MKNWTKAILYVLSFIAAFAGTLILLFTHPLFFISIAAGVVSIAHLCIAIFDVKKYLDNQ